MVKINHPNGWELGPHCAQHAFSRWRHRAYEHRKICRCTVVVKFRQAAASPNATKLVYEESLRFLYDIFHLSPTLLFRLSQGRFDGLQQDAFIESCLVCTGSTSNTTLRPS